jgi:hypothetical protein
MISEIIKYGWEILTILGFIGAMFFSVSPVYPAVFIALALMQAFGESIAEKEGDE